ncbi:MAG: hypothetical protein NTZ05_04680, partial [Chloroflexi bacterium]|nr:hypothetical protein [Chloroflexota bacterium]
MAHRPPPRAVAPADDYAVLTDSFRRTLLAENKSPQTIRLSMLTPRDFGRHLAEQGMPQTVAHIKREHVEMHIADLNARLMPATHVPKTPRQKRAPRSSIASTAKSMRM